MFGGLGFRVLGLGSRVYGLVRAFFTTSPLGRPGFGFWDLAGLRILKIQGSRLWGGLRCYGLRLRGS